MNKLNVSPSATFYVGDWDTDVHAASRAGAKTVAFSPNENREFLPLEVLQQAKPHHVVDSHRGLRELLVPGLRAILGDEGLA
jgi:phosphoglycolate phosphatase-like HAD superfamily hydrolase